MSELELLGRIVNELAIIAGCCVFCSVMLLGIFLKK